MPKIAEKPLGLGSLRAQRAKIEGVKPGDKLGGSKSILTPKRQGSVRLNYTLRPGHESAIEQARTELSLFLHPLAVAQLIEAVAVACFRIPAMSERAVKKTSAYKGESILKDARASTVWFPAQLSDFLMAQIDPSPMKSITYFLWWIAEDWDWIRKHFKLAAR